MELKYALKTRTNGDNTRVFDPVRRRWVFLSPEELVRQLLIAYFIHKRHFPVARMSVERKIVINGMPRRYDLVLWDQNAQPILLAECKAPSIPVSQSTLDQIAQYNISLRVPYLLVTNGPQSYCCRIDVDAKTWEFLDRIPDL